MRSNVSPYKLKCAIFRVLSSYLNIKHTNASLQCTAVAQCSEEHQLARVCIDNLGIHYDYRHKHSATPLKYLVNILKNAFIGDGEVVVQQINSCFIVSDCMEFLLKFSPCLRGFHLGSLVSPPHRNIHVGGMPILIAPYL